jgi:amino acid transporter
MAAMLMFTVAALLSSFAVSTAVKWCIAVALILSSYAFCFSLPLAALVGHRGLSSEGPIAAKLVYAGNMLGALAAVMAALVLLYAGFVSL